MKNTFTIKRLIFFSLIIAFSYSLNAQNKLRKYLLTGTGQLVSGMLDGTIESISYHYENGFKTRFPKANDVFWNPAVSWKNKYKDGNCELGPKFAGSTTIFVSTTDAYHLLRTGKRSIDGLSLAYYINRECSGPQGKEFIDKKHSKKKWKSVAKDFIILTAIRCAGFHLTYSLAFKPIRNYQHN